MLDVSGLVTGSFALSPQAAQARNLNMLLILGDSPVINGLQRFRQYNTLDAVLADFEPTDPEALAATSYFSQTPTPSALMIGRWLSGATAGQNQGGFLTTGQQALGNFTAITTGSFAITINGVAHTLTGLDLSGQTNLNGVASVIQTALRTAGFANSTCVWTGSQFIVTSGTTGTGSTVSYATPAGSGTDISTLLRLTSATAVGLVPGYAAETPDAAIAWFANATALWYGLTFASIAGVTDDQHMTNAALIQGFTVKRIYGVTTQDPNTLTTQVTTDLASRLQLAGYTRTFCQYSSTNPYAVCSALGREFTVNFNEDNSSITLMYKQEPSVAPENLNFTQAQALAAKRCNVFTSYNNNTSLLQYGVMSGPAYLDEIHGLDWLVNALQTACFNVLYTSNKIAQTDAGMEHLINACSGILGQAKASGLLAPGLWTSQLEFGELTTGSYLKNGYYIFAESVDLQSQADREARVAPPIQIAGKLAGAVHTMSFALEANR